MSCFEEKFYKREKLINRTLDIDENLYNELERLSKNVYDASINKLVNVAIEEMIKTENITFYKKDKRTLYVTRSFLIRNSFLEQLYDLRDRYGISIRTLVNIAVNNALEKEE